MVDNRQSTLLTPTVPIYNGSPFKPKPKRRSSGGGGSSSTLQPTSSISTPTAGATPQPQQQPQTSSSSISEAQLLSIRSRAATQNQRTANQNFTQNFSPGVRPAPKPTPTIRERVVDSLKAQFRSRRIIQKKGEEVVTKIIKTDVRVGNLFGLPTGRKIRDVSAEFPAEFGAAGEFIGGEKGKGIGTVVGGAANILTPKTVGEVALVGGGAAVLTKSPPIIRAAVDLTFAGFGAKTALDKSLPADERVAGGIVGAAGGVGFVLESAPFIGGFTARFNPKTSTLKTSTAESTFVRRGKEIFLDQRVKTGDFNNVILGKQPGTFAKFEKLPAGVEGIRNVPGEKAAFDIAIVPAGKGGGTGPAFKRGGFGFSSKEQGAFIGEKGTVTSGQMGFFEGRGPKFENIDLVKGTAEKRVGGAVEDKPLDRLFFGTPADIPTGIPQVRVSRIGLVDPFKIPKKGAEVSFLRKKPQVVFFENQRIGTDALTGFKGGGSAKGGGFTSELEVVTQANIVSGGKVGETVIKGQRVDLFSAELGDAGGLGGVKNIKGFDTSSMGTQATIPTPSATLPITGVIRTKGVSHPVSPSPITPSLPISSLTNPTTGNVAIISSPPVITISGGSGGSGGGSVPTPPVTVPSVPSSPPRIPSLPTIIPSVPSVPSRPPRIPRITTVPNNPIIPKLRIPKSIAPKQRGGLFGVQIRRRGQFFNVGNFRTQSAAFERGRKLTAGTLAATFRLTGPGKTPKAPKGFRRKATPLGSLFIEKRGFRLSKLGEVKEIQSSKKTKKKKKR